MNEIKDHVVEFKASMRGESTRPSLYVTSSVAQKILLLRKDPKVKDIEFFEDDGTFRESIEKFDIKSVRRMGVADVDRVSRGGSLVCGYGTRHPHLGREGFEECSCMHRFGGMYEFEFGKFIRTLFPEVNYSSDITPYMQSAAQARLKEMALQN